MTIMMDAHVSNPIHMWAMYLRRFVLTHSKPSFGKRTTKFFLAIFGQWKKEREEENVFSLRKNIDAIAQYVLTSVKLNEEK